jgi:tRNA G18 (ribose-2'-O)-methylase SpoU
MADIRISIPYFISERDSNKIPMWGINKSLNVIVSAAITSYWIINKLE